MNENQININPEPSTSEVSPTTTGKMIDKIKPIVKSLFAKFYSNKKIFWPVTISFGLIFLVLLIGLIFGGKPKTIPTKNIASPTPYSFATPEATSSGDVLTNTQNTLNDLDNQIGNFDVKQSRLTPPTLNFNISF